MNPAPKLMLSDEELQLVTNPGWILTKRLVIEKVCNLFGELAEQMRVTIEQEKNWLPPAVITSSPKISKGENYLQLPYVMLDYPRCFNGDDIFAIRTMFWWGNFFSITLQLSGTYKEAFQNNLLKNGLTGRQDVFICIHESQWQHHFEADNYMAVQQVDAHQLQQVIRGKTFVKLAVKFSLQQWKDAPALLHNGFGEMISLLKA